MGNKYDFFLSRRGSVSTLAGEVANVLDEKGYRIFVQNYDMPFGQSLILPMHEAIKNSRDLIVLLTRDYEASPYTRKEFAAFQAEQLQSAEQRRIVVLRCDEVPPRGFLADCICQDLVGIDNPAERKRRIIDAIEGNSQAPRPPLHPFLGVPPRINGFTGRSDHLDQIDAILIRDVVAAVTQDSNPQGIGRATVHGLGGVGKTSLAIEYAHRFRGLYAGVCWCPAETRPGILASLAGLATALGAATENEADIEKAARAALRRLAEQRATWLLVYDNVNAPEEIADLLPHTGARVLITSRFFDWRGWAGEVALDVLSIEEAVAFVQNRAGRSDEPGARALAEATGRLPLALDHASATCRRTQMRFADYSAQLSDLIAAAPRGAGYPKSVAATFDLAIAQAVEQHAAAETLMACLAQCAPERIPMLLLDGAIEDSTERSGALTALAEVSLVKHDPFEDGAAAVTVHRVVQAVARARSNARETAPLATNRLMARLSAIYPKDGYDNSQSWPLCNQLTPHLLQLKPGPNGETSDWANLLNRAGNFFNGRASYLQAIPLFRDALSIYEKAFNPEHSDTAQTLNDLALVFENLGDYSEAQPLYERALAIREKVLGPDSTATAESLNNLAVVLRKQDKYAPAEGHFKRALAIYESRLGPEDPELASSLSNLAGLYQDQHKFTDARHLYERALAISEKSPGPKHSLCAINLNNLGVLLHAQLDLAGARPLYERALAIFDNALGHDHPTTNRVRRNLARLLLETGHPTEALPLVRVALTAHEKALGQEHTWTMDSAGVTADTLAALGRIEEAAALRAQYCV